MPESPITTNASELLCLFLNLNSVPVTYIPVYLLALYDMKTLTLKIFYRFFRSETSNCHYIKTIYPIEMKLTGLIQEYVGNLHIEF